ncbi:MAG: hypothetical protein EOO52_18035 [Gammaproteobacteria bacterium]|nr:MAG: hypothetical protein EOO52_18035 [Gammaproteobacteria bacterium]
MRKLLYMLIASTLLSLNCAAMDQTKAEVIPVRKVNCAVDVSTCTDFDAIVFVHGIYGDRDTFINPDTKFNWPEQMPLKFGERSVDIFLLNYQTELIAWTKHANPEFTDLTDAVYAAMKPLRVRQYRSIGFIAHSLGGNVVSTYIHYNKTARNHPASSQHAYVVTLATPVLGAQIADIGEHLKSAFGMQDTVLASLQKNNLFLQMLLKFRKLEGNKREMYGCRAINLHAAYEEKHIGPLLVVDRDSAGQSVADLTSSPIVGFNLNHFSIAKPTNQQHEVYRWVNQRIEDEFVRLSTWSKAVSNQPYDRKLCTDISFKPEV